MRIPRTERVFIYGPSGSGKTTLLGLVAGVLRAPRGMVEILGQDLGAMSGAACDAFRGDHLGYIFQMLNLIPYLSVLDNITGVGAVDADRRAPGGIRREPSEGCASSLSQSAFPTQRRLERGVLLTALPAGVRAQVVPPLTAQQPGSTRHSTAPPHVSPSCRCTGPRRRAPAGPHSAAVSRTIQAPHSRRASPPSTAAASRLPRRSTLWCSITSRPSWLTPSRPIPTARACRAGWRTTSAPTCAAASWPTASPASAATRVPPSAFSCKGRGVCPSCNARRMVEVAAAMGEMREARKAGMKPAATATSSRSAAVPAYVQGSLGDTPNRSDVRVIVPLSLEEKYQARCDVRRLGNEFRGPVIVRAALVHLDFVAVHPFPDGNGRIARFLMNLCLVTAGIPWVTIRTYDRTRYFDALEEATVREDARPFARFVFDYVMRAVDSMIT